jgi:CDP-glucose 4,6-dehydratase
MDKMVINLKSFYNNKKVFITGHTGFKGTWLTKFLTMLGAEVLGYSDNNFLFYESLAIEKVVNIHGDICDFDKLRDTIENFKPDIIFHLAAQPLVIDSYENPYLTYETNVRGTYNLLESIRNVDSVKLLINITTDKVYSNVENINGYSESDNLDGHDPYSNSKSISELLTWSYYRNFFIFKNKSVITFRAGNVIGGGDFSKNRIVPDIISTIFNNKALKIRNLNSVRPYQHVFEPIFYYIYMGFKAFENTDYNGAYNISPNIDDHISTKDMITFFEELIEKKINYLLETIEYKETNLLYLKNNKIKKTFDLNPSLKVKDAVKYTFDWYNCFYNEECNIKEFTDKQILKYLEKFKGV